MPGCSTVEASTDTDNRFYLTAANNLSISVCTSQALFSLAHWLFHVSKQMTIATCSHKLSQQRGRAVSSTCPPDSCKEFIHECLYFPSIINPGITNCFAPQSNQVTRGSHRRGQVMPQGPDVSAFGATHVEVYQLPIIGIPAGHTWPSVSRYSVDFPTGHYIQACSGARQSGMV